MDSHDFRWCDEAAENTPHHHPHPVWLLVKDTAITVGERLHRLLVVDRDEGRGTDFSQAHQDVVLVAPGRLCLHEVVLGALAFPRRHHLVDADEGGYLVRMVASVQQAERRSPRVTDQDDLLAAEAPSEMIHDSVEVGDVLRNGQAPWIHIWIERASCAALVPVNHHKMCFK